MPSDGKSSRFLWQGELNMIHLLWECENVRILLEALDNWTLKNGNFPLNY